MLKILGKCLKNWTTEKQNRFKLSAFPQVLYRRFGLYFRSGTGIFHVRGVSEKDDSGGTLRHLRKKQSNPRRTSRLRAALLSID